jgi:hypothetical protein
MKFLFNRLLPAAIINATLIFLCVIVPLYPVTIIMFVSGIFEPSFFSSWYFEFWKVFLPAVAPLLFRVIWQILEFERSPGEQWLLLNWPDERQSKLRVAYTDIATGSAATLIAFVALDPCQILAGRFFCQRSNGYTLIAGWTMVPLVYCCTLASVLLLRYGIHSARTSIADSIPLSSCLKNTDRLQKTIAMFSMPFFCAIAGFIQTPGYYSALLYQPATWLLLIVVVIWWAAGAVIVRYWDSPRAYLFYLFFFVYPGVCCLSLLPAISTILKVGKLSEIY